MDGIIFICVLIFILKLMPSKVFTTGMLLLLLASCGESSKPSAPIVKEKVERYQKEVTVPVLATEIISGPEGSYSFEVPRGLLQPQGPFREINSAQRVKTWNIPAYNGQVSLYLSVSYLGTEGGIFSYKELKDFCEQGLQVTYSAGGESKGWVVASGYDKTGMIVYRRGDFADYYSMRGREEGEMLWVWSKAMILEFKYPKHAAPVLNDITGKATKSFNGDVSALE